MSHSNKILLMDDDPDHLLFCILIFQRRGYEVFSLLGCNRDEFLRIVANFTPNLIFMDHRMRGMSGGAAIQALRGEPKYRDIPVIYFSAEPNIVSLAKEAGADAHLKKPFTIQRLLDITKQFIP